MHLKKWYVYPLRRTLLNFEYLTALYSYPGPNAKRLLQLFKRTMQYIETSTITCRVIHILLSSETKSQHRPETEVASNQHSVCLIAVVTADANQVLCDSILRHGHLLNVNPVKDPF